MASALSGAFSERLRNEPASTATEDVTHIAALMGSPFTGTPGGAERELWVSKRDFPEAFRHAPDNAGWGDLVTGLGLIDMGPFGTIICPMRYTRQINFRWMERNYEASILEYNPEETAARLLRSNEKSFVARLHRRGIAAQMEIGYMYTEEGIQHWFYQTQAFADSVKMTVVADVCWSLFNAHKSAQLYEKQHGFVQLDQLQMIEREVLWYGLAHLNPESLTKWDNEAKRWAKMMNVTPDVYVTEPRGAEILNDFFEEHKWYVFVGPDGSSARMPGAANNKTINNTPVYVTPAFSPYDSNDATPTTVKLSIKGNYYLMLNSNLATADPHKRNIRDRSIVFYNEDTDADEEFTLVKAIQNCNVWRDDNGEVDDSVINKWRNDPRKSFMYSFKRATKEGQQVVETCRFFGHQEQWALNHEAIVSTAESSLRQLSPQDRNNINLLFETFKEIRAQPTATVVLGGPGNDRTDVASIKAKWAALDANAIRTNAAFASFPGLEALAAKDPVVREQVNSFKLMVRFLGSIYGGFSHLVDGNLCPVFYRDFTNDRAACTAWHLIVDEETAPTFFASSTAANPGTSDPTVNYFDTWDAVEEKFVHDPSVAGPLADDGSNPAQDLLEAVREAAIKQRRALEERRVTSFAPAESKAIKAPLAFVKVMGYAKNDRDMFARTIAAALDVPAAHADPHKYLTELTPVQAVELVERCRLQLARLQQDLVATEWAANFTVWNAAGPDAAGQMLPSPYVATALTCGQAAFDSGAGHLSMAHPGTGFSSVYQPGARPTTPEAFYRAYDRSRPTTYQYPTKNYDEDAVLRSLSGGKSADEMDDEMYWEGRVPGTAANPMQDAYAAVDRLPVKRGGDNDNTSIRHAKWFTDSDLWDNSPSFVNNWNRILGTMDVGRRVSMAVFLFTRISKHSLLKMCEQKYVDIPVNAGLFRPAHVHAMGGFILTQSGPDTGETFWTNPIFRMEESATLLMFEAHYAIHMKTVIKRPENVIRYDNAYFAGYHGGGGHRVFTMEEIQGWYTNHFFPESYVRGSPSIQVVLLPVTEVTFEPYIDITGKMPVSMYSGTSEDENTKLDYTSAHFYRDKYYYSQMPVQKMGWMSYYPRPTANRLLCAGRYYGMDETGRFDESKATRNRGHCKEEFPGIAGFRAGNMIRPLRNPLNQAVRTY